MKLYIDPGTGSMLFAILIGIIGAVQWMMKSWIVKLRFLLSGGKTQETQSEEVPLVIFSDDKRYWSVFEPVCRELDRKEFDVVYMTASPNDPALKSNYPHVKTEFIGEGNKAFSKLNFLKATIVLSTTPGLDVYQWKRSREVKYYVHMLHAASDVTGYRMFGLDYYDAVLLSGEYQKRDIRKLEELRNLNEKELHFVGIPYMDEMARRLSGTPEIQTDGKTVLIAPSWGKSAIFSKYGGKIIDILLKTDYHIIIRPHPQSFTSEKQLMETLMIQYPASERIEWNRDPDNFDVLRRADIMISDFSGVVFDFTLVYNKPVIYADTSFDSSPYDACWLDTPYWTFTALPRIGEQLNAENIDMLPELIEKCLSDSRFAEGRDEIRKETWMYPGEGAQRVADYLIDKYASISGDEGRAVENK